MTNDPTVIEHWINEINNNGINLSKWETDFMESITEQFEKYKRISDKQEEIIERIYTDKVP